MMRGNKSLRGSQPPSPSASEDDNELARSPLSAGATSGVAAAAEEKTPSRGRPKGKKSDGVATSADAMDVGA